MGKMVKNSLGNFLVICLIFVLITGWFFSGWPQIWQNPPIPPEILEARAATPPVIEAGDITESGYDITSNSWALDTPAYEAGDLLTFNVASDANVTHDWPAATGGLRPFGVTNSGNDTASTSWAVSRPAYSSGDLIVFNVASDANVTHDWPATGPNSETIVTIVDSHNAGSTAERVSAFYYIATDVRVAGTLTVTPSATEQWTATVFRVPAGDFNATTPIDSSGTGGNSSGTATSVPSPAWSATSGAANGIVVVWLGVDADPMATSIPLGWTTVATVDRGASAGTLAVRVTRASASESIASANWTIAGDSSSTLGYVINTSGSENTGDTIVTIVDSHNAGSTAERVSAFYFVATEAQSAGYVVVTPSATEQRTAAVVKVLAGEFDPTTPIQATVGTGGASSGSSTTVPSPSWTSGTADGRVVVWLGVDTDPITGTPSGWTNRASTDRGAVSGTISTRDVENTTSEVIASANWTIAGDSSSTLGYIVNAPVSAVLSISVSDGDVSYGTLNVNTARSTLPAEENEAQTATNESNIIADINIKGTDTAGWTLDTTNSTENHYIHKFCNDTDNDCTTPPTGYTALTTNYQSLKEDVAATSGTVLFQLQITTPQTSSVYTEQEPDVTVCAAIPD